jgi:hypothetical protein
MTTQTSYSERMPVAFAGQMAGSDYETVSKNVETAAGIGFGLAVSQGVGDKGIVLGGQSEDFVGVTIKDITLVHAVASLDKYVQYETAGVIRRGQVWVQVGSAVAAGDVAHFNASTGVLSNAGGETIAGSRFETSAGSGEMALLYLSGAQNLAAS